MVNNSEIERLIKENNELKFELNKITSSLNKLGKGKLMRNSDLGSLYDE